MAAELEDRGNGVFTGPGARTIDRSGLKRLPIGRDGYVQAIRGGYAPIQDVAHRRRARLRAHGNALLPPSPLWQDA